MTPVGLVRWCSIQSVLRPIILIIAISRIIFLPCGSGPVWQAAQDPVTTAGNLLVAPKLTASAKPSNPIFDALGKITNIVLRQWLFPELIRSHRIVELEQGLPVEPQFRVLVQQALDQLLGPRLKSPWEVLILGFYSLDQTWDIIFLVRALSIDHLIQQYP